MNSTDISYFRSDEPKESYIRIDWLDDLTEYVTYEDYKRFIQEDKLIDMRKINNKLTLKSLNEALN